MELWIRSQDKTELVKVNNLANIDYRIVFINNGNGRATLGTYATKERALEVLNEIQKCLSSDFTFNGRYEQADILIKTKMINGLYGVIYEMPKE